MLCGVVVCVHMYYRIEFYTQKQVYAHIRGVVFVDIEHILSNCYFTVN